MRPWARAVAIAVVGLGGLLAVAFLILHSAQEAAPTGGRSSHLSLDLADMTKSLPSNLRAAILASPRDFLQLARRVLDEPADLFALVDKAHSLARDYAPMDLVNLKDYSLPLLLGSVSVRRVLLAPVLEMSKAAKADGVTLVYSSGYRSFDYQAYVYAREVKEYGHVAADRESARPGSSQHQLGTALDFGSISDAFDQTPAGKWLAAHAWEYGFSLSYPQGLEAITGYRYEGWHYRFLTKPGLLLQRKYFGDIQQYMLEFLNGNWNLFKAESARLP